MKRLFAKALNLFSVLLLTFALCVSLFCVAAPNRASAAWDGTLAASFASGSGTSTSPYKISTEKQLGYFLSQLASGVTYEGQYIQLTKSLDMTGGSWNAVGSTFQGNFHGMGYTITAGQPFLGIIGANGTVQGVNYVLTKDVDNDVFCTTNNGTLIGCVVKGNASSNTSQTSWTSSIGLLCSTNNGTILSCGGVGTVYAKGDDSDAFAGLVARNYGTMKNCYSAVSPSASAPGKYNYDYQHPLAGQNNGTVTDCAYDATIYTAASTFGVSLTTAELQGSVAMNYLNSNDLSSCRWTIDSDFGGYPHMTPALSYKSYVTSYQGESLIHYGSSTIRVYLSKDSSYGTIYYSLDPDVTDPAKFTAYTSGQGITISGDAVLSSAVKYNGLFGPVTRQEFFCLPGSGTDYSPYNIGSSSQLRGLHLFPDAYFVLTRDITITDSDYTPTGAIPGQWTPVPSFSGTLDGKGYAISGLKSSLGGLIASNSGTVSNLRMVDHRLHSSRNFGAIANVNSGTVTRCYTSSALTLAEVPKASDQTSPYTGGVVGDNTGTVSYCRNDGIVYTHSWAPNLGGIVGRGDAENCINTGLLVVIKNGYSMNYIPYIGGITSDGDVTNCLSTGDVYLDAPSDYDFYIGGLIADYGFAKNSIAANLTVTRDEGYYYRITQKPFTGRYTPQNCYLLEDIQLPADAEGLDFDSAWMLSNSGPVPQGVMDENGHAYRLSAPQILPTCRANGDLPLVCDICGDTELITIKSIGHRYTTYTPNGDAACLEDGTKTAKCDRCDATDTQPDPDSKLGHTFTHYVSNGDAACLTDGTKTARCDRCDVTDTQSDVGSKLGHEFTNYVSNSDAVCLTDGTKTAKCSRCDVTDTQTDTGTALGHSFTAYVSNQDAACETDGTKTAICDRCEVTDTQPDADTALGHSFTNYVSNGDATCDTDGTKTAICDRCDATNTLTDTGSAGHVYTNYVSNGNATCLYPGTETALCDLCQDAKHTRVEVNSQLGHSFLRYVSNEDATCLEDGTETAKCDRCPVTDTRTALDSKLGHSFTAYVSNGDVTCETDGTQSANCDRCEAANTIPLKALGHNLGQWYTVTEATCLDEGLERADCDRCDYFETQAVPEAGHSFETAVTAPTCTAAGYTTYTCHCGYSHQSTFLPATGHTFGDYVSDGNATCLENGTQTAVCANCPVTDTIASKALGHSFTNYVSLGNATCTADGTKLATCDRCDAMDIAVDTGSMLGHTLGEWNTVTEAGCLTAGLAKADCIRCQHSESRILPAVGHLYKSAVTAPTCTDQGFTTFTCVCGDRYVKDYVDASGHSFTNYVSQKDATCTNDGTKIAVCDHCDVTDQQTDIGSKLEHDMGQWITITEANCLSAGSQRSDCSRCDHFETKAIAATGHSFTAYVSNKDADCLTDGTETAACDICQATDTRTAEGTALGHDFASGVLASSDESGHILLCGREGCSSLGSKEAHVFKNGVCVCGLAEPLERGSFNGFTWLLTKDNALHFYGEGTVSLEYQEAPWQDYISQITAVTVHPGATYIYSLCYDMENLETVTLPDTLRTLGHESFFNCGQSFLEIPSGVIEVQSCAVYSGTGLCDIQIPDSVIRISENAFEGYEPEMYYAGTKAQWDAIEKQPYPMRGFVHYEIVNPEGHLTITVTDPTCTEEGYEARTCSCGEPRFYNRQQPLDHSFTNYVENNDATCDNDGTKTAKCDRCDVTDTRTVPGSALKHDYEAVVTQPTCLLQGYTTYTCRRCNNTYSWDYTPSLNGHLFENYVFDNNATCLHDGTKTANCERCDTTDTQPAVDSALGHTFGPWYTVTEAGCTTMGFQQADCIRCDIFDARSIDATGHTYNPVITAPTCTSQGYTTYTCHCGESYEDDYIGAQGHSFTNYVSRNDATCTEDGTKAAVCSNCGTTDVQTDVGSVLGHNMGKWYTVTESDCITSGTERSECSRCDFFNERGLPPGDHKFTTVVTAPTCVEEGYTTYTCHCGESDVRDFTDPLGHSFGDWYYSVEPTVSSEGQERRDCSVCVFSETRPVASVPMEEPVLSLSANADTGKPILTWNKVAGAAKYRVYRATSKNGTYSFLKTTISVTTYTDTSAKAGTNYYYRIKALQEDPSEFTWSNIVNRVCDLPTPDVTLSVKTATGQPVVKWKTVSGAARYRVYRAEAEEGPYELVYTATSARSYTDTTAEAGVEYFYKMKATHTKSSANSAYSAPLSRICDLPKPVVSIRLSSGSPRLTWKEIDGATKYRIYRASSKNGEYELIKTTVTATSFTDRDAAADNTWYYKVKAVHENAEANSAYSTVKYIKAK